MSWISDAKIVPIYPGARWTQYLVVDEADDLWVWSYTHQGLIRFNRLSPAHWCFWLRSRWDRLIVRWGDL